MKSGGPSSSLMATRCIGMQSSTGGRSGGGECIDVGESADAEGSRSPNVPSTAITALSSGPRMTARTVAKRLPTFTTSVSTRSGPGLPGDR